LLAGVVILTLHSPQWKLSVNQPAACQLHPAPTTVTAAHAFINDHNRVSVNKRGASGGDMAEWFIPGVLGSGAAQSF